MFCWCFDECIQFHLIEYQDHAEYIILLIYFSISDLISV